MAKNSFNSPKFHFLDRALLTLSFYLKHIIILKCISYRNNTDYMHFIQFLVTSNKSENTSSFLK